MRSDVTTVVLAAGMALAQGCLAQADSAQQAGGSTAAVTVEEPAGEPDADQIEPDPCAEATKEARDLLLERCDECHRPREERNPGDYGSLAWLYLSYFESIRSPSKMIEEGYVVPDAPEDSKLFVILERRVAHYQISPPLFNDLSRAELHTVRDWISCGAEDWPESPR